MKLANLIQRFIEQHSRDCGAPMLANRKSRARLTPSLTLRGFDSFDALALVYLAYLFAVTFFFIIFAM